jgi:IMP dehydrogenase
MSLSKYKLVEIEYIDEIEYNGVVYDLTVDDDHSYNADGIAVHNSACSTRNVCAVGVPTFQALLDCVPHKKGAYLVADGGISEIGDVIKAIAIGADMVMIGKMFAATSLSGARKFNSSGVVIDNPELYTTDRLNVEYYGMASAKAQSVLCDGEKHSVEGVGGFIPYYGSTENFVESMEQNFRSSLAYYMGVTNWYELRNNGVRFVELSDHGRVESTIRM